MSKKTKKKLLWSYSGLDYRVFRTYLKPNKKTFKSKRKALLAVRRQIETDYEEAAYKADSYEIEADRLLELKQIINRKLKETRK